jgi:RimJ/RimL family protein N-acetyltransferase
VVEFRCPTVETERLILRPLRIDDLAAYTAMLQTPQVRASLHLPDDIGEERAFEQMEMWLGQWQLRNTGQWALEEKATGTFAGRAGSHWPQRPGWPGIEIGWTLHPDHWGKGYASEAGAAARDYAFANHGVDAIYSVILDENTRSQGVAKRLGFTPWEARYMRPDDELPHMIWRLTRADYLSLTR